MKRTYVNIKKKKKYKRLKTLKINEENGIHSMSNKIAEAASKLKPIPDYYLSQEKHTLPTIVNMVVTVTLIGGMGDGDEKKLNGWGLNLYRIALQYPNVKYRQKKFAAIALKFGDITGLLFENGKIVIVSAKSEYHALFYAQQLRQWVEKIKFLMWDEEKQVSYVGDLSGKLNCVNTKIENIVASGSLFQGGVDLKALIQDNGGNGSFIPDIFPNASYGNTLPDGQKFKANISDSKANIVVMGVKSKEQIYQAYGHVKKLVSNYEDPNAPDDPQECYFYRMKKLLGENVFKNGSNKLEKGLGGFSIPVKVKDQGKSWVSLSTPKKKRKRYIITNDNNNNNNNIKSEQPKKNEKEETTGDTIMDLVKDAILFASDRY